MAAIEQEAAVNFLRLMWCVSTRQPFGILMLPSASQRMAVS